MTTVITLPAALDELREYPQWVTWTYEGEPHPRTGKRKKMPKNPKTGGNAMTNTPSTWASYDRAVWALGHYGHDGLGFVFTKDDPFVGIDLDDCFISDGHTIHPVALDILGTLYSYTEISPSGNGMHIIVKGEIDRALDVMTPSGFGLEMYDTVRWFTMSGDNYNDLPITDAQAALDALIIRYRLQVTTPELPAPRPAPASFAPAARREWAERVMGRAANIVASAPDGHKHHARLKAARLAGGLIPLGLADEASIISVLYNANPPAANARTELAAIKDGIAHGARTPLDEPAVTLPSFDQGWALCPDHGRPLRRSKNGNGWRCGMRDRGSPTGWCGFWWQGEGYAPPTTLDDAPAPPPTARPITIMHGSELKSLPPVEWLIRDEVLARSVIMMYGESGTGKSFKALDWALQIAQTRPVLYIAAEGASGYSQRMDAWCDHYGKPMGKIYFVPHVINLMDEGYVTSIITAARGLDPALIIFDTLARSAIGADENSSRDMGLFYEACDKIKVALACSVMYVHHSGKSGSYRGSSALKGQADGVISLTKTDDSVMIKWEKNKDAPSDYVKRMALLPVSGSLVAVPADSVTSRYDEGLTSMQRAVLEVLANPIFETHGAPARDIKAGGDFPSDAALYTVLGKLKSRGLIRQGKSRDPYFITDAGHDALAGVEPTTYAEVDGYGQADSADSYAADAALLDVIKEAVQRLAFDEAQALAAGIQLVQRQAAAMIRIQQLRAAHTLDTPTVNVDTDLSSSAADFLDTALATMCDTPTAEQSAAVNNAIVDYADLCQRHALTVLWHQRKAEYDAVNAWLDTHFNEDDYYDN